VSETPLTDKAFIGDIATNTLPEIRGWEGAIDFARDLERRLSTATACLVRIRDKGMFWVSECEEQARLALEEIGHE